MGHASYNAFPVMNESTQVILQKIDFQKILHGIERTDLFVRLKVLVEQVQHLPSPNGPSLTGLSLLEVEDCLASSPLATFVSAARSFVPRVTNLPGSLKEL